VPFSSVDVISNFTIRLFSFLIKFSFMVLNCYSRKVLGFDLDPDPQRKEVRIRKTLSICHSKLR
jgi:hypothetical protein